MKKEQFEKLAMDYLRRELDAEERSTFESFLKHNPQYAKELSAMESIWVQMNGISIPEPSEKMDAQFFGHLHSEIEKNKKTSNWASKFFGTVSPWPKLQLAYGLLILGIGLTLGYVLNSGNGNKGPDSVITFNQDTEEVREKLVLTLLEQSSANKRLQGVSEANKIGKVDEKVITALLKTLNNDSNVNVRLAAIESLANYTENAIVRQGLVQSIPNQESPIVQVTLANLMTALQEKKSIEPFRKLLKEKKLDTAVKKKIESTIESII